MTSARTPRFWYQPIATKMACIQADTKGMPHFQPFIAYPLRMSMVLRRLSSSSKKKSVEDMRSKRVPRASDSLSFKDSGSTRKQSLPFVPRTALSHHLNHIFFGMMDNNEYYRILYEKEQQRRKEAEQGQQQEQRRREQAEQGQQEEQRRREQAARGQQQEQQRREEEQRRRETE